MLDNLELESGDIRVVDVLIEEDNETITGYAETWFDVEKKFGIELDRETEWLNMYVSVNPFKDTVRVHLVLRSEDEDKCSPRYTPTENEKKVIYDAVVEAVQKEYHSYADEGEYVLKGFVRSERFCCDEDILIYRGDGMFMEIYYNPDSNAGGTFVEDCFDDDLVEDAYKRATEKSKNEDEIVREFFDIIMSECNQYNTDVDTESFDEFEYEFESGQNFSYLGEVIDHSESMETIRWLLDRSRYKEERTEKTYWVPISWRELGHMVIKAKSIEEAIEKANHETSEFFRDGIDPHNEGSFKVYEDEIIEM